MPPSPPVVPPNVVKLPSAKVSVVGNAAFVAAGFDTPKIALYHNNDAMNWFDVAVPNVCVSLNCALHCGCVLPILNSGVIGSVMLACTPLSYATRTNARSFCPTFQSTRPMYCASWVRLLAPLLNPCVHCPPATNPARSAGHAFVSATGRFAAAALYSPNAWFKKRIDAVKPFAVKLAIVAVSNAWVGTNVSGNTVGRMTRNPSVLKKKNSLSFLIGPPSDPPHWFALLNVLGWPARNQSWALNELPFQ